MVINPEKREEFMGKPTKEVLEFMKVMWDYKKIFLTSTTTCMMIALERIVKLEEEVEQLKKRIGE